MRVGDLVQYGDYIGLIVKVDEWATLVEWMDGGVCDIAYYKDSITKIKVIS